MVSKKKVNWKKKKKLELTQLICQACSPGYETKIIL